MVEWNVVPFLNVARRKESRWLKNSDRWQQHVGALLAICLDGPNLE